jgi:hypothetical protein
MVVVKNRTPRANTAALEISAKVTYSAATYKLAEGTYHEALTRLQSASQHWSASQGQVGGSPSLRFAAQLNGDRPDLFPNKSVLADRLAERTAPVQAPVGRSTARPSSPNGVRNGNRK